MPVDLSIKRVPDALAERLRKRARRNHRSLQGELMAILQETLAAAPPSGRMEVREHPAAISYGATSSASGWDVAPKSEAALMIRDDRDGRSFRVEDLYEYVKSLGAGTPDESTAWIRKARSSR